ncbi:MAG: hypothetical protein U9O56_07005 [Campylobacterota bacterium]|nr:hypothetical protein [Campylobacterota bacterium]
MINRYTVSVLLAALLVGCGGSKKQVMPPFEVPEYNTEEEISTSNGISIHGMSGQYPITYKDKQLGDGLFNHIYFDISKKIINKLSENIDKAIIVKIKTNSSKQDVKEVRQEGIKYFKMNNDFTVWDKYNINTPDVIINVVEENSVKFIVSYHSSIFDQSKDDVIDLGLTVNEVSNESVNPWSKVSIVDNMDNLVVYEIMKNTVTVSDFDSNQLGDNPITNIKFSDADQYCFEKYNGYLSPIYIYEYALRQGAIKAPEKGISQEMIAGYDDANENDRVLKKDGDIIKSDMSSSDDAYAEILIFNHKSKRYSFKRDNFTSKSVSFRCSK